MKKILAYTLCLIMALPQLAWAAINCDQTTLQSAITAASAGDTITCNTGSWSWDTITDNHQPDVNAKIAVQVDKPLKIVGSGSTITSAYAGGSTAILLWYAPTSDVGTGVFELSGFTFDGAGSEINTGITISGGGSTTKPTINIHDNTIQNFTYASGKGIRMGGTEKGVIYSNTLTGNTTHIYAVGANTAGWSWTPYAPGSADYVFIEDNTMSGAPDYVAEFGQGGRGVIRHNTLTIPNSAEFIDMHGRGGNWPTDRGTVAVEAYNNTITAGTGVIFFEHRGGRLIAYNNTVSGNDVGSSLTNYDTWYFCTQEGYPTIDQLFQSYYYNNTMPSGAITPYIKCPTPGACVCDPGNPTGHCVAGACSPDESDTGYITLNTDYFLANPVGATISGVTYSAYTYPHPLRGESGATTMLAPFRIP